MSDLDKDRRTISESDDSEDLESIIHLAPYLDKGSITAVVSKDSRVDVIEPMVILSGPQVPFLF